MIPVIRQLNIYPLKSAKPIRLKEMEITASGPRYDRQWMLVKPNGQFLSQRTHPLLGQIQPTLTKESLILSAPKQRDLEIPIDLLMTETKEISIFEKKAEALRLGELYDQWASDYLEENVHFVFSKEGGLRQTSGNHGPKTPMHFSDGYPFLLTNRTTLDVLNKKLSTPISMDRFRPNIVIGTEYPDAEDNWESFEINEIPFLPVKACSRCKVIDIDPSSGESDNEVTKTLKSYRLKEGKMVFGQNLIHQGEGKISIGDPLEKVRFKPSPY